MPWKDRHTILWEERSKKGDANASPPFYLLSLPSYLLDLEQITSKKNTILYVASL